MKLVKSVMNSASIVIAMSQLLCLMPLAAAASASQSRLIVHMPQSVNLMYPNGFVHQTAMFGQPLQVGQSIVQPLYHADSALCDLAKETKSIRYHPASPLSSTNRLPFLLMINRGGGNGGDDEEDGISCSFIQQVRNAQHIGAAGVLIADNRCLCSDHECLKMTNGTNNMMACQSRLPILANDGSGHDITIPSYLMLKQDADLLKKTIIQTNQTMLVEMSYVMPQQNQPQSATTASGTKEFSKNGQDGDQSPVLTIDFWMSPTNRMAKDLVTRFHPAALAFQSHIQFNLHMFLLNGTSINCHQQRQRNSNEYEPPFDCLQQCTNDGRYCAVDLSSDFSLPVSGAANVQESLRQLCIWSRDESEGVPGRSLWWNYAKEFYDTCFTTQLFDDEDCIDRVFQKVGISRHDIDQCMSDSGGLTPSRKTQRRDAINNKLEAELTLLKDHSIYAMPTIHIDQTPFLGRMTANSIFHAVCGHLKYILPKNAAEQSLCARCGPSECTDFGGCVMSNGTCPDFVRFRHVTTASSLNGSATAPNGVTLRAFGSSIILLVVLVLAMASFQYRRMRHTMRQQVQSLVSDYVRLVDTDDEWEITGITTLRTTSKRETLHGLASTEPLQNV
ncbi:hypothetical protein ACA910_010263 [Epithemia clementina (nom. ined.)]